MKLKEILGFEYDFMLDFMKDRLDLTKKELSSLSYVIHDERKDENYNRREYIREALDDLSEEINNFFQKIKIYDEFYIEATLEIENDNLYAITEYERHYIPEGHILEFYVNNAWLTGEVRKMHNIYDIQEISSRDTYYLNEVEKVLLRGHRFEPTEDQLDHPF